MPDFDKLQQNTERLNNLLKDKNEGLSTWCEMVGETWKEIAEQWSNVEDIKLYKYTLKRLTIAASKFIDDDTEETLKEIEQAKFIAEELLMGKIDIVKELMK